MAIESVSFLYFRSMNLSDIQTEILLRNNAPIDDFLGLSPNDMYHLLYYTFGEKSPMQLKGDIDNVTLDQIPFFRICEEFLKILERDKFIKLTPRGALTRKILIELYSYKFITEEFLDHRRSKVWNQENCISIQTARFVSELAGLIKKSSNKLSLTKSGTTLIKPDNRIQLFQKILIAFVEQFNWGFNDRYPQEPVGRLGWAFSLLLLHKFGNESRTTDFYGKIYLTAFPQFISFFNFGYSTPENQFIHCYSVRTFERFFLWFGFVTIERQNKFINLDTDKFVSSCLAEKLFAFDQI